MRVSPSRANQVFSKLPFPGGGDGKNARRCGWWEAPGLARALCRPDTRHKWFGEKGRSVARPGKIKPILVEVTSSLPSHLSPIPSSLPARRMTPQPESPRARSRVGGRAATKTTATSPPGEGTLGGWHGWDWEAGWSSRTWGGRCGGGQPGWCVRRRGARVRKAGGLNKSESPVGAGQEPGKGRRVPARRWRRRLGVRPGGHFLAAPLAEPGLPALGRRRRRASRLPGGLEGKPGHRFADALRSGRPGLGVRQRPESGPERAGRAGGRERRGLRCPGHTLFLRL